MAKKHTLDKLKVESFVTSLDGKKEKTVKGGESVACTNATGGCFDGTCLQECGTSNYCVSIQEGKLICEATPTEAPCVGTGTFCGDEGTIQGQGCNSAVFDCEPWP